jgi:hypothetical protein
MLINKPLILSGSTATTGYTIDQSIRFPRASNTSGGYMEKTYSGAGDRTAYTFSTWFKLGSCNGMTAGSNEYYGFFSCETGTNDTCASGEMQLRIQGHSTFYLMTTRKVRDPSAWYHLVVVWDTDNAVSSERVRMYLNGERQTDFAQENYPSSGTEGGINQAAKHRIGACYNIGGSVINYPWDGYMADIHFLDGYSYGPEYFGETNSSGLWIPKEYDGSYGSNGFKIDGRDSSDLGDDESGNGNDYTTSGLAAHDQVSDTPTNNFAVLNPVDTFSKLAGELRNGNLELKDNSASVYVHGRATFGFDVTDSDGWYWESCDVVDGSQIGGITEDNAVIPSGSDVGFTGARGSNSVNTNYWYKLDGTTYSSTSLGVNSNAGDIAQFCVKNGKLFIGVNGTYVLSGNPATEANPLFTGLTGIFMPFGGLYSGASYNTVYNFGQDGTFAGNKTAQGNTDANGHGNFFYAPPSGAKALCSRSLGS